MLKALVAEEEERATRESMVEELRDRQDVGHLLNWDLVKYLYGRQRADGNVQSPAWPVKLWGTRHCWYLSLMYVNRVACSDLGDGMVVGTKVVWPDSDRQRLRGSEPR